MTTNIIQRAEAETEKMEDLKRLMIKKVNQLQQKLNDLERYTQRWTQGKIVTKQKLEKETQEISDELSTPVYSSIDTGDVEDEEDEEG